MKNVIPVGLLATVLLSVAACNGGSDGSSSGGTSGSSGTSGTSGTPAAPACTPTGAPITHSTAITANETWTSGIHVVPATLEVKSGARLTVEKCSEVRLGADASIIVDATGSGIDSNGTADSPITFHRDSAMAAWGSLQLSTPATAKLAFTTFDGGGGAHAHGPTSEFEGATLVARGDTTKPTIPIVLSADHVSVTGSTGIGVFLRSARFDPASTQLTVRGAGWYPVYGGIASAASLPDGSYTGNATDQILLQTISAAVYDDGAPLSMDATLHDRGVPYLVGTTPSSIEVGSGRTEDPAALLTIDAKVTILFTPQGAGGRSQLIVKGRREGSADVPQGALVVLGTAAAPVTFGSAAASPKAGDWQGLYFAGAVDPRTNIAGAHILDAGGNSGTVGVCESMPAGTHPDATCAVVISVSSPPHAFLHDSSIVDSANCGVYRLWGVSDVDFAATNQFTHVPGCVQSNVPDMTNLCPMTTCRTAP